MASGNRRASSGFNEAPIHESGKYQEPDSSALDQVIASMRPRFMNRGSHQDFKEKALREAASMRPRFMNRGSVKAPRLSRAERKASMRPRFMNRGSLAGADDLEGDAAPASMRPRFMNRGSHGAISRGDRGTVASMRPRFMNRGSAMSKMVFASGVMRFNEAPIHESGKCRLAGSAVLISCCFNEAPIHESGKSRNCQIDLPRNVGASMRPRFMNRGSSPSKLTLDSYRWLQ